MGENVIGASDAEQLAIIAGGPEMNAGEHARALYLFQSRRKTRKLPRHSSRFESSCSYWNIRVYWLPESSCVRPCGPGIPTSNSSTASTPP